MIINCMVMLNRTLMLNYAGKFQFSKKELFFSEHLCSKMMYYRQMPTTKEIYNLSGRFYIISSPKKITRFPPPKFGTEIINSDISAQEYWETVRRQIWSALSPQIRATFTWTSPGEPL